MFNLFRRRSRTRRRPLRRFFIPRGEMLEDRRVFSVENWTGDSLTDSDWTSNTNWESAGGAGPNDALVFGQLGQFGNNRPDPFNDFEINTRFHSIAIDKTNYVISGNQIFLTAGISSSAGDALVPSGPVFNPNIILDANQAFGRTTIPSLNLNGVVNLNGHTLNISGTAGGVNAVVFNGFINGSGTLNVAGNATINGDSSGFGTTEIDTDGRLRVNSSGQVGAVNLNGGTLMGSGIVGAITSDATNGGTISPGGLTGSTDGIDTLTATGQVNLNSETTLDIGLGGSVPGTDYDQFKVTGSNINLNNAHLDLDLMTPFVPALNQQFTIVSQTGVGSISGQFAQGNTISIFGNRFSIAYSSGSVVLTYQGQQLTWDGLGTNDNWSTAPNWDFDVVPANSESLTFPAGVANLDSNNNINNLRVGTLRFTGGGYTITGNDIDLGGGVINTAPGGPVQIDLDMQLLKSLTYSNNGQSTAFFDGEQDLNGFVLTIDGITNQVINGDVIGTAPIGFSGITKNGTGNLTLAGNNTYTGLTVINSGTVTISRTNALGDATGTTNHTVLEDGTALILQGNVSNIPESIGLRGNGGGAGSLIANGCNTGCSTNGNVGPVTNSTISVPTSGHTLTLAGRISGSADLTKIGAGKLILSGNNSTYIGTTTINAGTLLVNGDSSSNPMNLTGGTLGGNGTVGGINATGGTVAPGTSAGKLNANGNVTFNNATTFAVEVGGATIETEYDQLNVTGTIDIGAGVSTLSGTLINAFSPAAGQQFTIIQSTGALTGTFAQGNSITIGGVPFTITYNPTSVVLSVGSPHPWHNDANPLDVVGSGSITPDGHVAANDALAIVNYINAFGAGEVPANAAIGQPFGFIDTNADDNVAPNDVLAIINAINSGQGGEGEPTVGNDLRAVSLVGRGSPNAAPDLLTLLALDMAQQATRRRRA